MELGEAGAFDRAVVSGASERDDPLFAGVGVDHEMLEARRHHFVLLREQENGGNARRARVRDAVQIGGNFGSHRSGEQPQVPPAELAQDDLPQGGRIVQDQAGDLAVRRDVQSRRGSQARAEDDDRAITSDFLQFVECRQGRRA